MTMEIEIHRSLSQAHVVGFHGFFEDKNHVYILLELCRRRSLMELHKRRKALTEPEVRYFLKQTLLAVQYLHDEKVLLVCTFHGHCVCVHVCVYVCVFCFYYTKQMGFKHLCFCTCMCTHYRSSTVTSSLGTCS